jgi:hypothetical protein
VALLKWTAERYPQSSNAMDSLADAYLAAGDKASARRATERELELLEHDPALSADGKARLAQSAKQRSDGLK